MHRSWQSPKRSNSPGGSASQVAQQAYRFAPLARCDKGASKISYACRATSRELDRFSQFRDRFIVHVLLKIRLGELIMCQCKIGIHFDRLAALSYRFVVRVGADEELCQIGVNDKR